MLAKRTLLAKHGIAAVAAVAAAEDGREADLVIDLFHALHVSLGGALGAKDDVLANS